MVPGSLKLAATKVAMATPTAGYGAYEW